MPMPTATMPTTRLVSKSVQRGTWLSPYMRTVERMKATMNVKKAMPIMDNTIGRERNIWMRLATSGL